MSDPDPRNTPYDYCEAGPVINPVMSELNAPPPTTAADEAWASRDREKLADWMSQNGFATGHGDTLDDLLGELSWQIKELRQRKADGSVKVEIDRLETENNQLKGRLAKLTACFNSIRWNIEKTIGEIK